MNDQPTTPLWRQALVPIILLVIFVFAIWGVIKLQNSFKEQPKLNVSLPDISSSTEPSIGVTDKVTPKSEVTVNGKKVAVDEDGNFSYLYTLSSGENKLIFKAKKNNEVTTVEKIVKNETPAATTAPNKNGSTSSTVVSASSLANSGPVENVGIVGLLGIILSLYFYRKSKKQHQGILTSRKLFTQKSI